MVLIRIIDFMELKGGEIVQVGGLGYINTLTASGKNPPNVNGVDFAGLIGSLMGNGSVPQKNNSLNQSLDGSSNQELGGILDLLKSTDVFDVKDGNELLNKVLKTDNNDLLSTIKDFLGLNDQDLKKMVKRIQSMLSNVSVEKEKGSEIATEKAEKKATDKNAEKIEERNLTSQGDASGSKDLDELLACLNQIVALPIQALPKMINQDFCEMVKVVKLYELLTNNQDGSAKNPQLTEQIQQTIQKLEAIMDQSKGALRTEYLQKTFSSVATDVKSSQQSENVKEKNPLTIKLDSASGMIHLHQMSKPEQLMVMSDKSGKPVTTDQLMQQFENILSKSQFSKIGGTQKLLIKLNPENLGSLRIELTQKDSTIVAKIITTTGTAKDVLEAQLQGLKHAFSSQNIQVDRIEVTQQFTTPQESSFHREQQQGQQQSEEQSPKEQPNDGEFNQSFEEALLNMEV
jgi:flagellar hook-length control protein FliK